MSKIQVTCEVCGKQFKVYPSQLKYGRGKTCSNECSYKIRALPMRNRVERTCARCGKTFEVVASVAEHTTPPRKTPIFWLVRRLSCVGYLHVRERVGVCFRVFGQLIFVQVERFGLGNGFKRVLSALPLRQCDGEIVSVRGHIQERVTSATLEIVTVPIVVTRKQHGGFDAVALTIDDAYKVFWRFHFSPSFGIGLICCAYSHSARWSLSGVRLLFFGLWLGLGLVNANVYRLAYSGDFLQLVDRDFARFVKVRQRVGECVRIRDGVRAVVLLSARAAHAFDCVRGARQMFVSSINTLRAAKSLSRCGLIL